MLRLLTHQHEQDSIGPLKTSLTWRQVINRDLSVAALRYFVALRQRELAEGKLKLRRQHHKAGAPVPAAGQKGARNQVRVLEGLAASGLRAIRYALEARRLWYCAFCCCIIFLPGVKSEASS